MQPFEPISRVLRGTPWKIIVSSIDISHDDIWIYGRLLKAIVPENRPQRKTGRNLIMRKEGVLNFESGVSSRPYLPLLRYKITLSLTLVKVLAQSVLSFILLCLGFFPSPFPFIRGPTRISSQESHSRATSDPSSSPRGFWASPFTLRQTTFEKI